VDAAPSHKGETTQRGRLQQNAQFWAIPRCFSMTVWSDIGVESIGSRLCGLVRPGAPWDTADEMPPALPHPRAPGCSFVPSSPHGFNTAVEGHYRKVPQLPMEEI
jgi:hypothetical protein